MMRTSRCSRVGCIEPFRSLLSDSIQVVEAGRSMNEAPRARRKNPKRLGTTFGLLAAALVGVTLAVWAHLINRVEIPENRSVFVFLFLTAGALGIGAFVAGTRWYGAIAALPAIFFGALVPLTIAVSSQEAAVDAIQVGDTIPRFAAVDEHGHAFDSQSLRGHIVLIKFFRAHW